MKLEHTPGPWERGKKEAVHPWAVCAPAKGVGHYSVIASVFDRSAHPLYGGAISGKEAEANFCLICAAPDLYQAVKLMIDVQSRRRYPLGLPNEGIAYDAAQAMAKALAAVAKVENPGHKN